MLHQIFLQSSIPPAIALLDVCIVAIFKYSLYQILKHASVLGITIPRMALGVKP
jgi:hypothetical protein